MRNLKKILALVLALVMSFSLMATASAFSDDGDIAADYAEAIDVLSGLEVFKGYDNGATFQPKGSITRAEVAAIIYRIATGDVKDAQTSIYSSWGQFNDVKDGSWYAGYVNYCANAGYIKGYDSKTFGPNDPVTGYQALAMILRAIGYDKNNEFTGSNWQVRTASIAKQRGITDNIVDTLLGQSATREVVAEILFQSILVKTVTFNTNTLSYSENATSLGYDVLKLEKIEGVVVANQYADLADDEGMATGKTRIESADGDRTLNVVTTLDDIGESRYVYAKKTSNNGYNLVTDKMYDTGDNVIADQGAEIKVKDLAKKAKNADGNEQAIAIDDEVTKYFTNFDKTTDEWTSDYLIRYIIADSSLTEADREFLSKVKAEERNYTFEYIKDGVTDSVSVKGWVRTIKAGTVFEPEDKELMEDIFNSADRWYNYVDNAVGTVTPYAMGEVYVGTTSLKDYSDTMSWKGFRAEYINEDEGSFDKTTNGNYLKLVDNNNDGIVEYALKTVYTLDQVVSVTTKDDKDTYYYETLKDNDDVVTPDGGEVKFALNDVVIYAKIDGKYYTEVVTPVNATIKAVSFKDEEVTTTDDTVYGQSDIINDTVMDDSITAMDEQVEYNLYLDKFGFIRAYKLAQGSQYGLLTEMYPSRINNGAYVNNGYWIAELMAGSDKAPAEYNVLNSYYGRNDAWQYMRKTNPFIRVDNVTGSPTIGNAVAWTNTNGHPGWTSGVTTGWNGYAYNYLMEAAGHLGMAEETSQFDYDTTVALRFTNTNVAKYTKAEDGVNLYSAAEYAFKNGARLYYADLYSGSNQNVAGGDDIFEKYTENEFRTAYRKLNPNATAANVDAAFNALNPVYAVDYIQLAVENIKSGAAHYTIDADYATNGNQADPEDYNLINYANSNNYVDAVDDTEFYIVSGRAIQHIVGYKNMPAIDAKNIRSIYAVAENVNTDKENRDYWVANVIVIEVNKEFNYESVVMAWANPSQASRQAVAQANGMKAMSVVDSENTKIDTLIPDYYSWNIEWTNYGFYGVFDSAERDANTLTGSIDRLGDGVLGTSNYISYNDNGVYAGTVQRRNEISGSRAGYIDIFDGNSYKDRIYVGNARIYAVGYTSSTANYPTLKELGSYRELTNNDEIIYVKNAAGDISFIVDVSYVKDSKWVRASWLDTEYDAIIREQIHNPSEITVHYTVGSAFEGMTNATIVDKNGKVYALPSLTSFELEDWTDGSNLYIPTALFEVPNITLRGDVALRDMIEFAGVTYDGSTPAVVSYKSVQCYKIPNNYQLVELWATYNFKAGYDDDAMKEHTVVIEDITGETNTTESNIIDTYDVTLLPVGTVMGEDDMYKTLATSKRIVRVDFNLELDYYNPNVSVQIGADKARALVVHGGNSGFEYSVFFEWDTVSAVTLTIGAVSNKNLTYDVTLDTVPAGVQVVVGSGTYKVSGDTAVTLRVRTDDTYTVTADVNPNCTIKPVELKRYLDSTTGKFVNEWVITVTDVKADVKIKLNAEKNVTAEN